MTYEIDLAGLKRQLPICRVTDDLYIAAFVIFGDVELTGAPQAIDESEMGILFGESGGEPDGGTE